jgi:hypothetical protein
MTAVYRGDRGVSRTLPFRYTIAVTTYRKTVCGVFPLCSDETGCGVRITVVRNDDFPSIRDVLQRLKEAKNGKAYN